MKEYIIGKNDAGQRLDRFIAKAVPSLPSSLAQKYIRIKRVKVGGKGSKRDYKLAVGDAVQMYINDEFFEAPGAGASMAENAFLSAGAAYHNEGTAYPSAGAAHPSAGTASLDVIYEDDNIMLVNKEAGVVCHSSGGFDHGSLISRVQAYLFQHGQWRPREENSFAPALCNRIDRNTSGIVIAAKNAETLRVVNEKIKSREIDKYYLAAAIGAPDPPSGTLEGYIFKDSVKNQVYVTAGPRPGALFASTQYNTVAAAGGLSLVECLLITGRTHQIRAQFAAAGLPLLGDGKYGSERLNKPYGERRQALCSYKLVFSFKTDAGILSYLRYRSFQLNNDDIGFVKKYFPSIDIS